MSTSSFIEINNHDFEEKNQPQNGSKDYIIKEGRNYNREEGFNSPISKKNSINKVLTLKYPLVSLIGISCSLIFMVVAYSVYDGEHASGVVSFLGAIETNPAARSFFGLSLLTVGITFPYFCKFLNQILGEINNFGLRMGKLTSIGAFGIAIFEMQQQGNLHKFFAYSGFLVILNSMLYYSIKLRKHNQISGKISLSFFIGSVEIPLIMIIEMVILGIIFKDPIIIGSFEKAAIVSLFVTILGMNCYLLIRFRGKFSIDPNLKQINPLRDINDAKKVIYLAKEALFSSTAENRNMVVS